MRVASYFSRRNRSKTDTQIALFTDSLGLWVGYGLQPAEVSPSGSGNRLSELNRIRAISVLSTVTFQCRICVPSSVAAGSLLQARFI